MENIMKQSGIDWMGNIPLEWKVQKVKHGFIRKNEKAQQDDSVVLSLARSGVRVRDLSNNEGQIAESYYNYNPVEVGDLLLNPMDLYSGANCSYSRVSGVISPAYINLRAKDGYDPVYFDYYFKIQYWLMAFFAHGKGVSFDNRWTLSIDNLLNYPIIVPTIEVQRRIADFLDSECAEIDSVIEKTRASTDEYKKLKQSVIANTVIKGTELDVKYKDSGIEWINDIPEDSNVILLKYLVDYIESGVSVNAGKDAAKDKEYGVLKTSCVSSCVFLPEENKSVNLDEYNRVACSVKKNTVIVSRMNTPELVGACGYVEQDYTNLFLPDRLWQVHLNKDTSVKYIWYYLCSSFVRNYYASLSTGTSSSMQNISQGQFKNVPIVLHSLEQQEACVEYLDDKCKKIDNLISEKKAFIEDLEDYKKSLIFEYITGKREV